MLSPLPPAFRIAVACCCCCPPSDGPAIDGGPLAPGVLSRPEVEAAVVAARAFMGDTGRACGDFFRTLREGPTADSFLAGRATLLAKIRGMSDSEALFASTTVCANAEQSIQEPGVRVVLEPFAPDFPPEIVIAVWRNLDPFGTPRGVGFRGSVFDYIPWKNGLIPPTRNGFQYTVFRELDRSGFDSFCLGPACS